MVREVSELEHVTEATVLATCNRTEVYADVDRFHGSVEALSVLLGDRAGMAPEEVLGHLYVHYDDGAVSHLFNVSSGLDSMVLGESQILGQTREALRVGQEAGTIGPALNVLFQQALRVGKRSHAETDIDRVAPSLVGAALERAADHLGGLEGRHVVVVGAGSMAALTVAKVVRAGVASVVVANRTLQHATRLAGEYDVARAIPLAEVGAIEGPVDLLVSCTGATGTVVDVEDIATRRTTQRPLAVVDLALPRDVDTAVADLPGRAADRPRHAGPRAARGAGRGGHRRRAHDRGRGAGGVPGRPTQPERDPDGGGPALDGDRRRAGRARAAGQPAARPRRGHSRRGRAHHQPRGRQAAAPAHGPGQGAGQRVGRDLLRRRARRAVLPGSRGRRGRHPRRGSSGHDLAPRIRDPHRHARLGPGPGAEHAGGRRPLTCHRPRDRARADPHRGRRQHRPAGPARWDGRLRQRSARGPAAQRDRPGGALAEGPARRPTAEGIALAAVPPREDPRDVVVARDGLTLGELPQGARVGTGAPRRVAQLRGAGPRHRRWSACAATSTPGSRKVAEGELDAVVLARAGLARLGRLEEVTEVLDPLQVLPAPGQGALAVECRAGSPSC